MRHIIRLCGFLFLTSAATAAPSSEFKPLLGKLVRAYCHMDNCSWFSIQQVSLVGTSAKGELYAVAAKGWSSHHPNGYERPAPRTNETVSLSFILCSKTAPASIDWYASGAENGPKSWHLTPLKPGRSDTVFGFNSSGYVFYMAVCHANADVALATDERFGQRLGYRFANGDLADQTEIGSPFDALR